MSVLFEGLSFGERVTLLFVLQAALVGIIFLVLRLLKGKNVSMNLTQGQLSFTPETTSATIHEVVTGVFFHTLETIAMMSQIKTNLILHDQMTYLEERMVMIRNTILESYRKLLREFLSGTEADSLDNPQREYLFYKSLVDLMREDLKNNIRVLFLRNHFTQFNDQELSAYIKEKNQVLVVKMYEFLRDMYPSEKMMVPFSDVEGSLKDIQEEIEEYLSSVFRKAVQIKHERDAQIIALDKSLREKIKASYGVDIEDRSTKVFINTLKSGESQYERRS